MGQQTDIHQNLVAENVNVELVSYILDQLHEQFAFVERGEIFACLIFRFELKNARQTQIKQKRVVDAVR